MTSTQNKFFVAGLGGSWLSLLWAGRTLHKAYDEIKEKHDDLIDEHNELCIDMAKAGYMLLYLAQKLEDHGVEIDEFDLMVLNDPPVLSGDYKIENWITKKKAE